MVISLLSILNFGRNQYLLTGSFIKLEIVSNYISYCYGSTSSYNDDLENENESSFLLLLEDVFDIYD